MPRELTCPTCRAKVPVPPTPAADGAVTCPHCDEVFAGPRKAVAAYDPETDEAYRAAPVANARIDQRQRDDRMRLATRAARAATGKRRRPKTRWHQGPEVWLLIAAVGLAGGLPFGLWVARHADDLGTKALTAGGGGLLAVGGLALAKAAADWAAVRRG